MLKLEREKKGLDIHVRFRKNESLLTPLFWKAFAVALAFHILGLVLFHVQLFNLEIFPTRAPVKIYLEPFFPLLLLNEKANPRAIDTIPAPSLINWEFPLLPFNELDEGLMRWNELSERPLNEETMIQHTISPLASYYHPIRIKISGELAKQVLFVPDIIEEKRLQKKNLHSSTLEYQVRVDSETGYIFWYTLKSVRGSQKILQVAEKILHELRFFQDPQKIEQEGTVTFVFNEDER